MGSEGVCGGLLGLTQGGGQGGTHPVGTSLTKNMTTGDVFTVRFMVFLMISLL